MSTKKDYIEQYIELHTEAFNSAETPECGWEALDRVLDRVKGDEMARFIAANRLEFDNRDCPNNVWANIVETLPRNVTASETHQADNIESFINENRAAFDRETPDLRIWEQLSKQKEKAPALRISWPRQLVRSAAAIGLLIAGVGIGMWYSSSQQKQLAGMRMSDVSPEYAELESHFERDIESKKASLAKFTSNVSSTEVFNDLTQMDNIMEDLRRELADVPPGNREEVVRAMIENYKTKAKVLERVLKALDTHEPDNMEDTGDQTSKNSRI
jgi:hypothetical protein